MVAIIRVINKEEEQVINRLLAGEGVVLITEDAAEIIAADIGISKEDLNEKYLDSYDYGGDADKWVDVVRTEEHILVDYLKN